MTDREVLKKAETILSKYALQEKEVTAPFTSVYPLEVVIADTISNLLSALLQSDCFE